ncbi:MAG: hypothetical protein AAGH45_09150 [Pseudomonadota bacterium]
MAIGLFSDTDSPPSFEGRFRWATFFLPLVVIGIAQGTVLSLIASTQERLTPVNGTLIVCLLTVSLSLQLLGGPGQWRRAASLALPFVGVIGSVTFYRLVSLGEWQITGEGQFFLTIFWFLLAGPIVWLVLMTFAQAWLQRDGLASSFSERFDHFAWTTLPLVAFAIGFAALAMLAVMGAGMLLSRLDMPGLLGAVSTPSVFLALAFGFYGAAVALLRDYGGLFDRLSIGVRLACRGLMVVYCFFAVLFLGSIPFNGLVAVSGGQSTALVLLLLGFAGVLLFNGAYRHRGQEDPSALWKACGLVTVLAIPAYALIGILAVWLRVHQYGLTPERFTMFVCLALLTVAGLVYLGSLIWHALPFRTGSWMAGINAVNPSLAMTIAIVLLMMQTALLDPVAWTSKNQYDRIETGRASADAFDYGYLYFRLGEHGRAAFQKLERLETHPQWQTIRREVDQTRRFTTYKAYRQGRL